jgi:hypothetical protein
MACWSRRGGRCRFRAGRRRTRSGPERARCAWCTCTGCGGARLRRDRARTGRSVRPRSTVPQVAKGARKDPQDVRRAGRRRATRCRAASPPTGARSGRARAVRRRDRARAARASRSSPGGRSSSARTCAACGARSTRCRARPCRLRIRTRACRTAPNGPGARPAGRNSQAFRAFRARIPGARGDQRRHAPSAGCAGRTASARGRGDCAGAPDRTAARPRARRVRRGRVRSGCS